MYREHRRASLVLWFCGIVICTARAQAATNTVDSKAPSLTATAAAQWVQGAMAAEVRADRADRDRLVEQALHADPEFAPARWQSGQVRYDGYWMTVDAALENGAHDRLLQQYRQMRSEYGDRPEDQLQLARWCQTRGLIAETRAHASQVLAARQNDPEVLKMLNLTWRKGQLTNGRELELRKGQDDKARLAMHQWRPVLGAIRDKIESKSSGEHDEGMRELAAIHNPAAIETLVAVFKNRPSVLCEVLHVIGQIPGQEATDALLQQAILTTRASVRTAACDELKIRSMYGYVPKLIGALSSPIQAKLEVVGDNGAVHFRETLRREGGDAVISKTLDTNVTLLVPNPNLRGIIGETYEAILLDIQKTTRTASKINRKLRQFNESIYAVLENTVGTRASRDPEEWWSWWRDYTVTSMYEKPVYVATYYNYVDVPYVPLPPMRSGHGSCFARGTMVWTFNGQMPIENVQIGDRVLSQNPLSGELTFKPVLDVTVGQQDLFAIDAEGQQIVATAGHLFWVSGVGWRMTKELKKGNRLHTVSGWSEIQSIKPLDADKTHNLVVADFNTYFVGDARILTHDITMPQTVTGGVPGELVAR